MEPPAEAPGSAQREPSGARANSWGEAAAPLLGSPQEQSGLSVASAQPGRLVSAVSSLRSSLVRLSEETALCGICCCRYRPAEMRRCPAHKPQCGPWCEYCLAAHAEARIRDGFVRATDLCCPGADCSASLLPAAPERYEQELAGILRPLGPNAAGEALAKWKRFRQLQRGDTRECPFCGSLERGRPGQCASGEYVADIACAKCGKEFCFYHSNAHAGRSCEEYLKEPGRRQEAECEARLLSTQKPCPNCGRRWQKAVGSCNHMTCPPPCGAHWCWLCGQRINPALHFADLFGTGGQCAGRMYDENDAGDGAAGAQTDAIPRRRPGFCDSPFTTPPQFRWAKMLTYLLFALTAPVFGAMLTVLLFIPLRIFTFVVEGMEANNNVCRLVASLLFCPVALGLFPLPIAAALMRIPVLIIAICWGAILAVLMVIAEPFYWCCACRGRPWAVACYTRMEVLTLFWDQHEAMHTMLMLISLGLYHDQGDPPHQGVDEVIAAAPANEV